MRSLRVTSTREQLRELALLYENCGNHAGAAHMHYRFGASLATARLSEAARHAYARAAELFAEIGETANVALAEMELARTWSSEERHDEALLHGERALGLRKQLGVEQHVAAAMDNLGLLYADAGKLERAIALIEEAAVLAERGGDQGGFATALSNLGSLCQAASLPARAIAAYERALLVLEDAGLIEELPEVLERLAALHAASGTSTRRGSSPSVLQPAEVSRAAVVVRVAVSAVGVLVIGAFVALMVWGEINSGPRKLPLPCASSCDCGGDTACSDGQCDKTYCEKGLFSSRGCPDDSRCSKVSKSSIPSYVPDRFDGVCKRTSSCTPSTASSP